MARKLNFDAPDYLRQSAEAQAARVTEQYGDTAYGSRYYLDPETARAMDDYNAATRMQNFYNDINGLRYLSIEDEKKRRQRLDALRNDYAITSRMNTDFGGVTFNDILNYGEAVINQASQYRTYDEWGQMTANQGYIGDLQSQLNDLQGQLETLRRNRPIPTTENPYVYNGKEYYDYNQKEKSLIEQISNAKNKLSGVQFQTVDPTFEYYNNRTYEQLIADKENVEKAIKNTQNQRTEEGINGTLSLYGMQLYDQTQAKQQDYLNIINRIIGNRELEMKRQEYLDMLNAEDFDGHYDPTVDKNDVIYQAVNNRFGDNALGEKIYYTDQQFDEMTKSERELFNYIHRTQGKEAAEEFFDFLQRDLNVRDRLKNEAMARQFAIEHPKTASGLSTMFKLASPGTAVRQLAHAFTGGIDQNDEYNYTSYMSTALRNEVARNIKNEKGASAAQFYQIGMSVLDNLAQMAFGGGLNPMAFGDSMLKNIGSYAVLTMMTSDVFSNKVIEGKDKGLSDSAIIVDATVAALIEFATEKIGLDSVFAIANSAGSAAFSDVIKDVLKGIFSATMSEGGEEGLSDLGNWYWDLAKSAITGNETEIAQEIARLKALGFSEGEAAARAVWDKLEELGLDVAGGALSGFAMSGGVGIGTIASQGAASTPAGQKAIKVVDEYINTSIDDQMEIGLGLKQDSPAFRNAKALQDAGMKATVFESIKKLHQINLNDKEMTREFADYSKQYADVFKASNYKSVAEIRREYRRLYAEIVGEDISDSETPEIIESSEISKAIKLGALGSAFLENLKQLEAEEAERTNPTTNQGNGNDIVEVLRFTDMTFRLANGEIIRAGDVTWDNDNQKQLYESLPELGFQNVSDANDYVSLFDSMPKGMPVYVYKELAQETYKYGQGSENVSVAEIKADPNVAAYLEIYDVPDSFFEVMAKDGWNSAEKVSAEEQAVVVAMGKMGGRNVKFVNGLGRGINSQIDKKTGEISISVTASQPAVLAFIHEFTHSMEEGNKKTWDVYREMLVERLKKDGVYDFMKEQVMNQYGWKITDKMSDEERADMELDVERELVAIASETFLIDTSFVNSLKKKSSFFKKLRGIILNAYENANGDYFRNLMNAVTTEDYNWFKKFGELWIDVVTGVEKTDMEIADIRREIYGETTPSGDLSQEVMEEVAERVEDGEAITPQAEVQFSREFNEEFMQEAFKKNVETGIVDVGILTKAAENRAVTKALLDHYNQYLPEDKMGSDWVTKNGSYGFSGDLGTVCIRSLAIEPLMDFIADALGHPLTTEETNFISQDVMNYTHMPACIYCYVAMDRNAKRNFLNKYIDWREDTIENFRSGMDEEEVKKRFLKYNYKSGSRSWGTESKPNEDLQGRFYAWKAMAEDPSLPKISKSDLTSVHKMEQQKKVSKAFEEQINDAEGYAQSASYAKGVIGYTAYNNDILKWDKPGKDGKSRVEKLNEMFGLRMYSFTDYHPSFVLENMQMITDAATVGLKVLAYTKETDFADIFMRTGANINISVFAQRNPVDGEYQQDGMMGADWEKAKAMRRKSDRYGGNVGITLVAINDDQVEWACQQDWIDVVIPFHTVKAEDFVELNGWSNYKAVQEETKKSSWKEENERRIANGEEELQKTINPPRHQNDFKTYQAELEANHLNPKFPQWYEKWGVNGTEETQRWYMKLVNETRRSEGETEPVVPDFNMAAVKRSIKTLTLPYGSAIGTTQEGYEDLTIEEIADEIVERMRRNNKIQMSRSFDGYMELAKDPEKNKYVLQKMVDRAAEEAGWRPSYMYHGSLAHGFREFEKSRANVGGNSGAGFYVTNNLNDADQHYADISGADNFYKAETLADQIVKWSRNPDVYPEEFAERFKGVHAPNYEDAIKIAEEMINKSPGVYTVFLKYSNPYVRDYKNSTNIFDKLIDGYEPNVFREDYDSEYDYEDDLNIDRDEYIFNEIYQAVLQANNQLEENYEAVVAPNVYDLANKIAEKALESGELTWKTIRDVFDENWYDVDLVSDDMSESAYGAAEYTRAIIEAFGYDAIEDYEVSTKFGQLSRAMADDTYHTIVFSPEQIKSADPVTYDANGNIIPLEERFDITSNDIYYSREFGPTVPTFYSQLERMVEAYKGEKIGASSLIPYLKGKGVKDEEIKWSGIATFLEGKKSVNKSDVIEYLNDNKLVVEEKILSSNAIDKTWVSENGEEIREDFFYDGEGNAYEDENDFRESAISYARNELGIGEADITFDLDPDYGLFLAMDSEGLVFYQASRPDPYDMRDADLKRRNETRWGDFITDGGKNYREILYKLPGSSYQNDAMRTHWGFERGVIAHARVQDFETSDGDKVLFIEEIQSDWHNAGVDLGYVSELTEQERDNLKHYQDLVTEKRQVEDEYFELRDSVFDKLMEQEQGINDLLYSVVMNSEHWEEQRDSFRGLLKPDTVDDVMSAVEKFRFVRRRRNDLRTEIREYEDKIMRDETTGKAIPDAPFRNGKYVEFVLKDLLRKASDGGYVYLAWTPARMQLDRWNPSRMSTYSLTGKGSDSDVAFEEGYRIEYDQDIPRFLRKYGKQWGAYLTEVTLKDSEHRIGSFGGYTFSTGGDEYTVPALATTVAMRRSIRTEGQPMFSRPFDSSDIENELPDKVQKALEKVEKAIPGVGITKDQVRKIAERVKWGTGSKYSTTELADQLEEVFSHWAKNKNINYKAFTKVMNDIMMPVVNEIYDYTGDKMKRRLVQKRTFIISEETANEFGGENALNRRLLGYGVRFKTDPNYQPSNNYRQVSKLTESWYSVENDIASGVAVDLGLTTNLASESEMAHELVDFLTTEREASRRLRIPEELREDFAYELTFKALHEFLGEISVPQSDINRRAKEDAIRESRQVIEEMRAQYEERYIDIISRGEQAIQARRDKLEEQARKAKYIGRIKNEMKRFEKFVMHPTKGRHFDFNYMKYIGDTYEITETDANGNVIYDENGKPKKRTIPGFGGMFDLTSNRTFSRRNNILHDLANEYKRIASQELYQDQVYDDTIEAMIRATGNIIGGRKISELSSAELKEVYKAIRAFIHAATRNNNFIDLDEARDVNESAKTTIETIRDTKGSGFSRFGTVFDKWLTTSLNPIREILRLVDFDEQDPLYLLTNKLIKGETKVSQYLMEMSQIFQEMDRRQYDRGTDEYNRAKEFRNRYDKMNDKFVKVTLGGEEIEITEGQLLALVMHARNNDNMLHILYGGVRVPNKDLYKRGNFAEAYARGTTVIPSEPEISKLNENLDDFQKWFLSRSIYYFETYSKNLINATSLKLEGFARAEVENYYPIRVYESKINAKSYDVTTGAESTGDNIHSGMLQARKHSKAEIYLNSITQDLNRSQNFVSRYAGLAIPIRDFQRLYNMRIEDGTSNPPVVKDVIQSRWGTNAVKYIDNMLKDLTNGRDAFTQNWLDALRGKSAQGVLTLNISVSIKQAASYPTAIAVLDWKSVSKAFFNPDGNSFIIKRADMKEIQKWSPILWSRMAGMSTQEVAELATKQHKDVINKGMDKAPWLCDWIRKVDVATVGRLWYATKYWVSDHNPDLEYGSDEYFRAVADKFEEVVTRTQPNYTIMTRPDILRTKNSIVRALMMFKTQPLQNFGILYEASARYDAMRRKYNEAKGTEFEGAALDNKKQAGKALGRAVISQVVQTAVFTGMTFLANIILHKWNKYKDKEINEVTFASVMDEMMWDYASSLFGNALFGDYVEQLGEYFVRKFALDQDDATLDGISVFGVDTLSDIAEEITRIVSKFQNSDVKGGFKRVEKLSFKVAQVFGIPATNVYNIVHTGIESVTDIVEKRKWSGIDGTAAKHYWERMERAYNGDYYNKNKTVEEIFQEAIEDKDVGMEKLRNVLSKDDETGAMEWVSNLYINGTPAEKAMVEGWLEDFYSRDYDVKKKKRAFYEFLEKNVPTEYMTRDEKEAIGIDVKAEEKQEREDKKKVKFVEYQSDTDKAFQDFLNGRPVSVPFKKGDDYCADQMARLYQNASDKEAVKRFAVQVLGYKANQINNTASGWAKRELPN